MKRILIVVDMQTDFVDGVLGTPEAVEILDSVAAKIKAYAADPDGLIFVTYDTHTEDYMNTSEGKHLPVPHCIKGTSGWQITEALSGLACHRIIDKPTFGSRELGERLVLMNNEEKIGQITLVGLCTDICVISNAMLAKAFLPETPVSVIASACAGVSVESHNRALEAMGVCQIEIK